MISTAHKPITHICTQNTIMALLRVGIAGVVHKKLTGNVRNILLLASCFGFGINLRRMAPGYEARENIFGNIIIIWSAKYLPLYMTTCTIIFPGMISHWAFPTIIESTFYSFCAILKPEKQYWSLGTMFTILATNITAYIMVDFVWTEMANRDLGLGRGELIFKFLLAYSCCAAVYDVLEDMICNSRRQTLT